IALGWGPLGLPFGISDGGARTTELAEAVTSVAVPASGVAVVVRDDDVPPARVGEDVLDEGGLSVQVEDGALVIEHTRADGWTWFSDDELTILLPRELAASTPDVTVTVSTASIDLRGDFGAVDLEAQTGSIRAEGTYERFAAETSTGSIDLEADGEPPAEITARTGTGSVDIEVPAGSYAVETRPGTGSSDVEVDVDANSPHTITVETGTGSIDITD
ncbi:MAG: hypothetical protein Q4F65_08255, partial [Propionibacteriaceae bacterium]|nr:hypothetical protein [Propionibacteriaceae bacterium]